MDQPFYLQSDAENIITQQLLDTFATNNPELSDHIYSHDIVLRPLNISDFESFCAWIISQQISGKVAQILYYRLRSILNPISPDRIRSTKKIDLLNMGLSKSKVEYLYNLSDHFLGEEHIKNPDEFTSDQLIKHYTKIRGIGPWTVNMWLIFSLGRLDIFAAGDLAVRKGLKVLYDLDRVPTIKEAHELGRNWKNLATIGTILAWAVRGE